MLDPADLARCFAPLPRGMAPWKLEETVEKVETSNGTNEVNGSNESNESNGTNEVNGSNESNESNGVNESNTLKSSISPSNESNESNESNPSIPSFTSSSSLTHAEFLALWDALLCVDPALAVRAVLQLGYFADPRGMVEWKRPAQKERRIAWCRGEGPLFAALAQRIRTRTLVEPAHVTIALLPRGDRRRTLCFTDSDEFPRDLESGETGKPEK